MLHIPGQISSVGTSDILEQRFRLLQASTAMYCRSGRCIRRSETTRMVFTYHLLSKDQARKILDESQKFPTSGYSGQWTATLLKQKDWPSVASAS